jgi:hypothetical protein
MYPANLLVLFLGIALSGCVAPPESRNALSEPGEVMIDKRLAGTWHANIEGEGGFYLHMTRRNVRSLRIVGTWFDDRDVDWIQATAHASEIDGRMYYNVKRVPAKGGDYTAEGEERGFILLRAELTAEDTLFLRSMNGSLLKNLIGSRRVSGRKVSCDDYCSYLVLDSSRAELLALIQEQTPERLFPVAVGPFRRLKPNWDEMHWKNTLDSWNKAMGGD